MGDDERVVGDPTEVLTRSGGTSYVSLTGDEPVPVSAEAVPMSFEPAQTGRRLQFIGWIALALAIVSAVLTGVGVGVAANGEFVAGASLAWVAIVISGVAVATGILALIAGFGRLPGGIAIVLGVLANPFVLTQVLGAVSAVTT